MKKGVATDQFDIDHPFPDYSGVDFLYKFTALDPEKPEYLSQLLSEGRLYFSRVIDLNDPWECKPAILLPTGGQALSRLRRRVERKSRNQ